MSPGNHTKKYTVIRFENEVFTGDSLELIGEEPLMIRVDDKSYSVVMRTPGEEEAHAVGLCLGEGLIDSPDDLTTIGYDRDIDPNLIDIWLTPERRKLIPNLLKRKTYVSQTSCGICGKKMMEDLNQVIKPVDNGFEIGMGRVFECLKKLSEKQNFYPRTRGSHAALLFDDALNTASFSEDVGRHNALDKAIGNLFLNKTLKSARLLVLSSRISYELVQKAARARIPMIISKSRPTALAVDMGKSLNMTLACAFESKNLIIFSGENRIKRE
ncbi:MAG: formate dehydrogenase accessory sulfurtransferase FdhD [Desulfobacula sp.]|jgi:FdhD protein